MFVGSEGIATFQEAALFCRRLKYFMKEGGRPLSQTSRVLDVGVGWGRLYRILLRDVAAQNLIGLDVDPTIIQTCRSLIPYGQFLQVAPNPPYPFSEAEFDLVYLYSVFSHLVEQSFTNLMAEFGRLLKSGGYVGFTTLKIAHLDVWEQRKSEPYAKEYLDRANFEYNAWRKKGVNGDFLYVPTGGGDPSRPADFYGEAIVTEAYLHRALQTLPFQLIHFSEPHDTPQSFVVLKRN